MERHLVIKCFCITTNLIRLSSDAPDVTGYEGRLEDAPVLCLDVGIPLVYYGGENTANSALGCDKAKQICTAPFYELRLTQWDGAGQPKPPVAASLIQYF